MRDQAGEARSRGARIVVFPELALTGYLPAPEVLDHCQPLDGDGCGGDARRRPRARHRHRLRPAGDHRQRSVQQHAGGRSDRRHRRRLSQDPPLEDRGLGRSPATAVEPYELAGVTCASWICYGHAVPGSRPRRRAGRRRPLRDLHRLAGAGRRVGAGGAIARPRQHGVRRRGGTSSTPTRRSAPVAAASSSARRAACWARAAEDTPSVIVADLDPEEQQAQKTRVPLLGDRRLETLLDPAQAGRDADIPQSVAGSSRGPAIWRPGCLIPNTPRRSASASSGPV